MTSKRNDAGIYRTTFAALLCFAALLASVSSCVLAEETFLFSRPFSGVHLMYRDSEERIIYRHGWYIAPRLSPDGQRILFHSTQTGKIGIWLTDRQGKEMERLCDGKQANWSSDGKKLIFSREGKIMEREIVSGKEKIIVKAEDYCEFPSYLPDGRVVFVSRGKSLIYGKISLTDPDKQAPPKMLVEGYIRSAPRCSPDGKRIAYQDGPHIYLMDLDNGKISQLTTAGGAQSWPMWSQDGLSICYCQSPEPFGGPWDICNVKIDSPLKVGTVVRDVEISPDWRGSHPSVDVASELKGGNLNLWQVEGSLTEKESWKPLPVNDGQSVDGKIVVENDWGVLYLSSVENRILILQNPADGEETELVLMSKEGEPATAIESIQVVKNDGENVVLKVNLGSGMEAVFTIPRSRPIVEIKPVENVERVYVKKVIGLALIPDRFADDLIFDPRGYSGERILLPYSPFLMGFPVDSSMTMIITPLDTQQTWLLKDDKNDSFAGIEVSMEGESVFVSLLPGENLWHKTEVILDEDGWKANWANPFLAQWRIAAAGKEDHYSRMWDEDALSKLNNPFLPVEKEFTQPSELSIVYLYGRSWNTPLDVVTPMDILQDALGIDRLIDVLDIEGIRRYRTADKPVPLHVLLTSHGQRLWPEDSPGWPDALDFSPFFPLLKRVRMVNRKGTESTAVHLCEDILNSLKGLDNRVEEYKKFLADMEDAVDLLEMEEGLKNLQSVLAGLPVTKIRRVSDSIEAIKSLSAIEEELWGTRELNEFQTITGSILLERQNILSEYRSFIKEIRNRAGIMVTEKPETRDEVDKIRKLTQDVLRNRYYLEGDWRGEKPL